MKIKSILIIIFFINLAFAHASTLPYAAGQMMMVGFYGTKITPHSGIVNDIKKYHIGGIILGRHMDPHSQKANTNIKNPRQLKSLIAMLQFYAQKYHDYPLFIAINQEGGLINTLKPEQGFHSSNDPSQFALGKINDPKIIFHKTLQRAKLLKSLGINLNFAPVADLNINPNNPAIGKLERSFGKKPQQVTQDLRSAISAYQQTGILCTLKHFPGLGSATQNTDFDHADLTHTWQPQEMQPYKNLIAAHTICPAIMVSHASNKKLDNSNVPASLSKKIVTDLLIKQLHYRGLIITDDMDAAAIRKRLPIKTAIIKAVLAGNNILIYDGTQGHDPDKDAQILFNILLQQAKINPAIRAQVFKSYGKIKRVKKILLSD